MKEINKILAAATIVLSTGVMASDDEDIGKNVTLWNKQTEMMVTVDGKPFKMERIRTKEALINGYIQPMTPVEGVTTVGERDIINAIARGDTMIVDMRHKSHAVSLGTIPSAISVPYTDLKYSMEMFGCEEDIDTWDCSMATQKVIAFCNSNTCPQSPTGIRTMVSYNYPTELISYYRGGFQDWKIAGLPIVDVYF